MSKRTLKIFRIWFLAWIIPLAVCLYMDYQYDQTHHGPTDPLNPLHWFQLLGWIAEVNVLISGLCIYMSLNERAK